MDVLFIFLVSTGFVGGLFTGLKKSFKKFITLFISLSLVSLLLVPIVKLLTSQGILKNDICNFLYTKVFLNYPVFSTEIMGVQNAYQVINQSNLPSVLKTIFVRFCEIESNGRTLGGVVSNVIYKTIITLTVAICLFIVCYILLNIVFSFVFKINTDKKNMFFTKRFISAVIGLTKNMIVFVVIVISVCYISKLLGFVEFENYLNSSTIISFGKSAIEKNISALISGIY